MNTQYIIFILILIIVILFTLQIISTRIEDYTNSSTVMSGLTTSNSVDTTPSKWNVSELQQIAESLEYKVTDWQTHIDILVNKIGCPFYGFDTTINNWTNYPYCNIVWTTRRIRFRWFTWNFRIPSRQCYANWINNRTYINSYKIDMNDYKNIMGQIVFKGEIRNDADLQKTVEFNNSSEQFSTIEGLTDSVNEVDVIKKIDGTPIINNKTIKMLSDKEYSVQSAEFSDFAKSFTLNGKTLNNLGSYIDTMEKFGISNENTSKTLKLLINEKFNPKKYSFLDIESLINTYFASYGITNVTDFFDPNTINSQDGITYGNFANTVMRFELHNLTIPLFPTTTSLDCVMERLKGINGINIPVIGKDAKGMYFMNDFFQALQTYNTNSQTFFNSIYNPYKNISLPNSKQNVNNTLRFVYSIKTTTLESAFASVENTLNELNLKTFNEYIDMVSLLDMRVGNLPGYELIPFWKSFKTYYTEVAYTDVSGYVFDNPITINTLNTFFTEIEKYYEKNAPVITKNTNPTYFSVGGNINKYIQLLNTYKYKISDIYRDIKLGHTYKGFLNMHMPTQTSIQGFSVMENDPINESISYISNAVSSIYHYIFGKTVEGNAPNNSDMTVLTTFGFKELSGEILGKFEMKLIKYNINDIDKNKSTWENIITFINRLIQLGITYENYDDFIKVMVNFGADRVTAWFDVMTKLGKIKLNGYTYTRDFIVKITEFGVKYSDNFDLFITNMTYFKTDMSSQQNWQSTVDFISDMKTVGYTYDNPQGTIAVNNIIQFFAKNNIYSKDYRSNSKLKVKNCEKKLPPGFPSLFIKSLYEYSTPNSNSNNTSKVLYSNLLYDVRTPELLDIIKDCGPDGNRPCINRCDMANYMQEAYMISVGFESYNDIPSFIIPNVKLIASFFYKEEMDNIISDTNAYSNMKKRVLMMRNISKSMIEYSKMFKTEQINDYKLYSSIANFLVLFPAISFQYLSTEFYSKNGLYSQYVNPLYTECKASTVNKSINYRTSDPIE